MSYELGFCTNCGKVRTPYVESRKDISTSSYSYFVQPKNNSRGGPKQGTRPLILDGVMHSNSGHKSLNSGQAKPQAVSCLVVVLVRRMDRERLGR